MSKHVSVKKKINVPLLIVLLIFGFVPGLIYLAWALIPRRVATDIQKPKTDGFLLRIIGAAVSIIFWIAEIIWIAKTEGKNDVPMLFYFALFCAAVVVLLAPFTKKVAFFISIMGIFNLLLLLFNLLNFMYAWGSFIGCALVIAGCKYGKKYNKYMALQNYNEDHAAPATEETDAVETAAEAETTADAE